MSVLVSGGFDPVHPGHLSLFRAAAKIGPVIVALNSDDWLRRKKGFAFQPWHDRAAILSALRMIDRVVPVDDSDGTVCDAIRTVRPDFFCNGGDRGDQNTPEIFVCRQLGVKPLFGIGGTDKPASSSSIGARRVVHRTWGTYEVLAESAWHKVKRLIISPGAVSSEQRHGKRSEVWFYPDGSMQHVPAGAWHSLVNKGREPLELIEVQIGECVEDDIERR